VLIPRPFRMIVPLVTIAVFGWLSPLTTTAAATPVAGGSVVIDAHDRPRESNPTGRQELRLAGTTIDPAPLDPAVARDVNSAFMTRQVFRGLTRFDENLEPVPELAQRIEISADGLTYRIQLRDNAQFADGSQITAEDVVFSLTRALSPQTAADAGAALAGPSYLGDIVGADRVISGEVSELSGLRVIDDRTVEIDLKAPRATSSGSTIAAGAEASFIRNVARGALRSISTVRSSMTCRPESSLASPEMTSSAPTISPRYEGPARAAPASTAVCGLRARVSENTTSSAVI